MAHLLVLKGSDSNNLEDSISRETDRRYLVVSEHLEASKKLALINQDCDLAMPRGIVTPHAGCLEAVSSVTRRLGLPGLSEEPSRLLSNKRALRDRLASAGVPQPDYCWIAFTDDVKSAEDMATPLYVSPADAPLGDIERRVDHMEDLGLAIKQVQRHGTGTGCIVQSAVPGSPFGVFGYVHDGGFEIAGIVGVWCENAPFRYPAGLVYPCEAGEALSALIQSRCQEALEAVGFDYGPVRIEVAVANEVVRVLDIDGTPLSGWMPRDLMALAGGRDFAEDCLLMATGGAVGHARRPSQAAAIAWLESRSGEVEGIEGAEEARAVEGVVEVLVAVKPGDVLGHTLDRASRDRLGFVVATGATSEQATATAKRARGLCRIVRRRPR